jgi:DNA-binding XRE family transcriptional regulator
MALPINPSRQDRKEREERAAEWRGFRRDYLYSQQDLASAIRCSRRTVVSVESGREVIRPSYTLLRRFSALKLKCERQLHAIERREQVA